MNRVKLEDIAELSGVSITTVSRYFNMPEKISSSTKQRIEEAIQALHYTRDNFAKTLSTGESTLIGVILPSLDLSFYSKFLYSTIDYCKEKGYNVIVYTSDRSSEEEKELIQSLLSYRIRGLILLSHMLSPQEIEELPLPVITIERSGGNYKQVNSDNYTGGRLAAELLIRNSCSAFVHINNGSHIDWPSYKRILGFEVLMNDKAYSKFIERDLTNTFSSAAYEKMEQIVSAIEKEYPTQKVGIFCSNDNIAQLLERVCMVHHIDIPSRFEIIGYDNAPISDISPIPITSVTQNIPLMSKIAVDSIDNYSCIESIIPAAIVEKATTSN